MEEIEFLWWVLIAAVLNLGMVMAFHNTFSKLGNQGKWHKLSPFTSIFRIAKLCRSKSKQSHFPDDV